MERITVEACCSAAFARALSELEHETRAVVTANENGTPWATVRVSPSTDTMRAVFPVYVDGALGDTSRRGQRGVMVTATDTRALPLVIERARKMHAEPSVSMP